MELKISLLIVRKFLFILCLLPLLSYGEEHNGQEVYIPTQPLCSFHHPPVLNYSNIMDLFGLPHYQMLVYILNFISLDPIVKCHYRFAFELAFNWAWTFLLCNYRHRDEAKNLLAEGFKIKEGNFPSSTSSITFTSFQYGEIEIVDEILMCLPNVSKEILRIEDECYNYDNVSFNINRLKKNYRLFYFNLMNSNVNANTTYFKSLPEFSCWSVKDQWILSSTLCSLGKCGREIIKKSFYLEDYLDCNYMHSHHNVTIYKIDKALLKIALSLREFQRSCLSKKIFQDAVLQPWNLHAYCSYEDFIALETSLQSEHLSSLCYSTLELGDCVEIWNIYDELEPYLREKLYPHSPYCITRMIEELTRGGNNYIVYKEKAKLACPRSQYEFIFEKTKEALDELPSASNSSRILCNMNKLITAYDKIISETSSRNHFKEVARSQLEEVFSRIRSNIESVERKIRHEAEESTNFNDPENCELEKAKFLPMCFLPVPNREAIEKILNFTFYCPSEFYWNFNIFNYKTLFGTLNTAVRTAIDIYIEQLQNLNWRLPEVCNISDYKILELILSKIKPICRKKFEIRLINNSNCPTPIKSVIMRKISDVLRKSESIQESCLLRIEAFNKNQP